MIFSKDLNPTVATIILLLVMIGLSMVNFFNGYAQDYDAYLIIDRGAKSLAEKGEFVQSRTYGFPLYEMFIYRIINSLGLTWAKVYSLIFALANTVLFYNIVLQYSKDKLKSFWLGLGFVVSPFIIISSNTIMETSQGLFFGLLGVFFFLKDLEKRGELKFFLFSMFFCALATATRPDYVILSFSIYLARLILTKEFNVKLILVGFGYVLLSFSAYILFYDHWMVSKNLINTDTIFNKLIKMGVGYLVLFGIPFWLLLTLLGKKIYWLVNKNNPITIILIIYFLLISVRFYLLPDEVEYVLFLLPLVLLFLSNLNLSLKQMVLIPILLFVPNITTIHLFKREIHGKVTSSIGLDYGAFIQEKGYRWHNEFERNELTDLAKEMAHNNGLENYSVLPTSKKNTLVIIPNRELKMYLQPDIYKGLQEAFPTQQLFVYEGSKDKGWKQMMRFISFNKIDSIKLSRVNSLSPLDIHN